MANTKDIEEESNQVNSLRSLTQAFGEIAATRMKKIRDFVLKNRIFLASIESIFKDALFAYAEKLSLEVRKGKLKEGGKVFFLAHNGKTVAVLISANTGFYGEVVKETFKMFIEDVRSQDLEVTIIGKVGRNLFLQEEPKRPYSYFELPDYGGDPSKLSEVINHLVNYEAIRVYFGEYQSVVNQKPKSTEISAGTTISGKVVKPKVNFLFEPNVEKILMFFETQIFGLLFDQSIRESQLAKLASRILAMDRAEENIRLRLGELRLVKLKFVHEVANRKQLNSLGPVMYPD